MVEIQRLNMDTSWLITINGTSFLIDPWLTGSEVDGFSWFNEQWHIVDPVKPEELPEFDYVLLSQSYEDHTHLPTLKQLGPDKKYIASGKAFNKIKDKLNIEPILLKEYPQFSDPFGNVNICSLHPGRKMDPIYYAIIFESGNEAVFYASHGFNLTDTLANQLTERCKITLLITTFTYYKLPGFMGGAVNPGISNALDLIRKLKPSYVVNTHDEKKEAKGFVSKIARVRYANFEEIDFPEHTKFIGIYDYESVKIS